MLQFPTNVYPQNTAISNADQSSAGIITGNFTFNGDKLACAYTQVYNNKTGTKVETTYEIADTPNTPFAYNGENVDIHFHSINLTNGQDYTFQTVLTQADESGNNIYDLYIGRGKTQADSTLQSLLVESGLNNIYEFDFNFQEGASSDYYREPLSITVDSTTYIVAGIQIEISGQRYFVTKYHSYNESFNLGEIKTGATSTATISKGTEYKLYANYLVSPFYFFKCRSNPSVSNVTATLSNGGIECSATYSQYQNVPLKYYKFYLYDIGTGEDLIAESEKIYSSKIGYTFGEDCSGKSYKVECEVCTQDGVIKSGYTEITFAEATEEYISTFSTPYVVNKSKAVFLSWTKSASCLIRIYREDVDTGDIVLIADTNDNIYADYTVANNKSYRYSIVPYYNNIVGVKKTSPIVKVQFVGWSITSIVNKNYQNNRRDVYQTFDTWTFVGDIENVTVTQNTAKTLHVGSAQFPILSEGNTNYMSGTFSALVGYVECSNKKWTDNIDIVNKWREFITQHCQFVLRSQKGDVWMVNITDNPIVEYDESNPHVLVHTSFSWAEFSKPEDLMFVYGISD